MFFSSQTPIDSRSEIISKVKARLKKRQHVLLFGSFGAGKSWLLDQAYSELNAPNVMRLSLTLSRKAVVVAIVQQMLADRHSVGQLDLDWAVAEKAVRKLTVEQLVEMIRPFINKYLYILDDLERATERTCADVILPLMDGLILAAADISSKTQVKRVSPVINHFNHIPVPALTKPETIAMLWTLVDREQHKRPKLIETQVWNLSQGKPGVIVDVTDQLGTSGTIRDVRELHHEAPGVRYVGLLPALLICSLIAIVVFRYAARGFSDPYVYVFFASGFTILRMMLTPIQKWAEG